jgi:oligopeptide transport system substrate-binding protein
MPFLRKAFPYLAIAIGLASLAWAISFGTLPKADFTFDNNTEAKTIDCAKATGQPENRIINGLFEGLLRLLPPKDLDLAKVGGELVPLTAQPACAQLPEIRDGGKTYTFKMRPGITWSDGSPLTAEDFQWSWMRLLHPETGSEYAYQLFYVEGAEKYNTAVVEIGDKVEVELAEDEQGQPLRKDELQLFPRGTVVRGIVKNIVKPAAPKIPAGASGDDKSKLDASWKEQWVYLVDIKPESDGKPTWSSPGKVRAFCKTPDKSQSLHSGRIEKCLHCLINFDTEVGIRAVNPQTLVVKLKNPTAYFSDIVAFYPLYPVNRACVERHGNPLWTRPENIVGNGPYTLQFRRIRDRIRMVKNPRYWDAEHIRLNVVDIVANKSETTSLNMFLTGQIDWSSTVPGTMVPEIQDKLRSQWRSAPMLTTYIYRLNVTKPPLDNPKVRRALNMAMDKHVICDQVLRAGQQPARNFVPPGLVGYEGPLGSEQNIEEARRLLAEAGYPQGRGLPTIQILYNVNDDHEAIAQVIQRQWKENLKIDVELRKLEWGVFLDSLSKLDYQVARSAWIADYPDPNTFLDMWVSGGPQNQTGWSNPQYDDLIEKARTETNPKKRMEILAEAETLLNEEQPIIPIYWYVSKNLVQPRVKGFFNNNQDVHPLNVLWIEEPPK